MLIKTKNFPLLLGFGQLLKRTKRSIRIRCWSPLSTEWMPEDKAKTFPLHDYPVQFELISSKSNTSSQNRISFQRIEDIFDLQEVKQPSKVLLKGMYLFIFNRAIVMVRSHCPTLTQRPTQTQIMINSMQPIFVSLCIAIFIKKCEHTKTHFIFDI